MAPATTRSELRRFVRDLRWIVPLWLAVAIGFGVYAGIDDGVSSGLRIGAGCVVLAIALAPIGWIRWHGRRPSRPSEIGGSLKRIGLAVAWLLGVLLAFAGLASIVDQQLVELHHEPLRIVAFWLVLIDDASDAGEPRKTAAQENLVRGLAADAEPS